MLFGLFVAIADKNNLSSISTSVELNAVRSESNATKIESNAARVESNVVIAASSASLYSFSLLNYKGFSQKKCQHLPKLL